MSNLYAALNTLPFVSVATCLCVDPPVFDKSYRLRAEISLPYAEIVEPIVAFYDPDNNRSRVDYYDGRWCCQ